MILITQPSLSVMMVILNPPYKLEYWYYLLIIGNVFHAKNKRRCEFHNVVVTMYNPPYTPGEGHHLHLILLLIIGNVFYAKNKRECHEDKPLNYIYVFCSLHFFSLSSIRSFKYGLMLLCVSSICILSTSCHLASRAPFPLLAAYASYTSLNVLNWSVVT